MLSWIESYTFFIYISLIVINAKRNKESEKEEEREILDKFFIKFSLYVEV